MVPIECKNMLVYWAYLVFGTSGTARRLAWSYMTREEARLIREKVMDAT